MAPLMIASLLKMQRRPTGPPTTMKTMQQKSQNWHQQQQLTPQPLTMMTLYCQPRHCRRVCYVLWWLPTLWQGWQQQAEDQAGSAQPSRRPCSDPRRRQLTFLQVHHRHPTQLSQTASDKP